MKRHQILGRMITTGLRLLVVLSLNWNGDKSLKCAALVFAKKTVLCDVF